MITADAARQIFRQLSDLHGTDRCVLGGLSTERSVMRATWTRDGASLPELTVTPAACASSQAPRDGRYAIIAGEAFAAACPATFVALRGSFAHAAPAPMVPALTVDHTNRAGHKGRLARVGLLLLAGVGAAVWWRRRRAKVQPNETSERLSG